jgi:hypothetical protein
VFLNSAFSPCGKNIPHETGKASGKMKNSSPAAVSPVSGLTIIPDDVNYKYTAK